MGFTWNCIKATKFQPLGVTKKCFATMFPAKNLIWIKFIPLESRTCDFISQIRCATNQLYTYDVRWCLQGPVLRSWCVFFYRIRILYYTHNFFNDITTHLLSLQISVCNGLDFIVINPSKSNVLPVYVRKCASCFTRKILVELRLLQCNF